MVLENGVYKVSLRTEHQPDTTGYAVLYQPEDLDRTGFYSAYLIDICTFDGQTYQAALLDQLISSIEPCAVLEDHILTVILFRTILRIDLRTSSLVQLVDCENMGGLEEIHPISGGYILKGEGDIFRYDLALNRVWHRSGRDIFVTPEADDCFWMENGRIHCLDWLGWHYELDLNGNTLREYKERDFD